MWSSLDRDNDSSIRANSAHTKSDVKASFLGFSDTN